MAFFWKQMASAATVNDAGKAPQNKFDEFQANGLQIISELQALEQLVRASIQAATAANLEWASTQEKCAKMLEKRPAIVTFNIGGELFTTKKTNLAKFPNSVFYAALVTNHWQPDEFGRYFIDKDPEYIACLMEYMRTGHKDFPVDLDPTLLKQEFEYFFPGDGGMYTWTFVSRLLMQDSRFAAKLCRNKIHGFSYGPTRPKTR